MVNVTPSSRIAMGAARRLLASVLCALLLLVPGAVQPVHATPDNPSSQGSAGDGGPPAVQPALPTLLKIGMLGAGWAPFEFLTQGEPSGLSVDYLRAVVGPDVRFEAHAFPDMPHLLAAVCAGEVDIVMSIARTPERERCLAFSSPYFRASVSLVKRRPAHGASASARPDGGTFAVEKGFALERALHDRYPHASVVAFDDTVSALRAVKRGDADAYAGFSPAVDYYLQEREFQDLAVELQDGERTDEIRFAVPRTQGWLRDRLNRGLAALPSVDAAMIRTRWLGDTTDTADVQAARAGTRFAPSPDERAWLQSLPALTVGLDTDWPPFSTATAGGVPAGIATDYLDYLSRTLGVKFLHVPLRGRVTGLTAFRRGDVDLLALSTRADAGPSEARVAHTYSGFPLAIVGRDDQASVQDLGELAGRRVALTAHAEGAPLVALLIPVANRVVVDGVEAGLDAVVDGRADALIVNVAAIGRALKADPARRHLKVLGPVDGDESLGFAVNERLTPLAGLIDRAMLAMPMAERQRISRRWVSEVPAEGDSWNVSALRLLPLFIAGAVVLLVTLRAYMLLEAQVSRRKRTERELALQLKFQQTMMEMAPYPLVAKDLDGRYVAVNRAFEELCGLTRADVIGRTSLELNTWGESNSRDLDAMAQETLRTGERRHVELRFVGPDGELRHGIFWSCLCVDVEGGPLCMLGTVVDITEIRRAELRARETERRLFDVTLWLPAVVFQLRRDVSGEYSFTYVSGNAQRLVGSGLKAPQAGTSPGFRHIVKEDRERVQAQLDRSAQSQEPVHLEYRARAGGRLRWCRAEMAPRQQADGSVVWSGYWVDASAERARSDELARARDQAEAASRAKDDFLAMMSHEIRTPMNGVLGLVEVLERTRLAPDQKEMLGMMHESAGALLQILDDLLDFSKIEAGRLTIEAEPVDLRELVDNAVGLLAGRAHEKGLKVRTSVAAPVAAKLCGDSVRLRQILFNLLSNAIKFTPAGQVDVQVTLVEETAQCQLIQLAVEDTGIGIEADAQARLFEPFVQAESSTTRRFGGTGLGLTICRKLVQLMDGRLELRSEPGVGTRMTMQLSMPVAAREQRVGGLQGKRALAVLRDDRVAAALLDFVGALGIDVRRVAADSRVLHDAAQLDAIDLVFIDETYVIPELVRSHSRVICATEKPKPTGYRVMDDKVRLSVNPISWRGLAAACAAALSGFTPVCGGGRAHEAQPAAAPDRDRAIGSGRLVLVAEDHPVNQELIRHQLALLGFACDIVNDGLEALHALDANRYGCLITDCHMPNLSGYDLARQVRVREAQRPDGKRLPILGITANTAPEDLLQCREAGMDDCLVKPTRLATLREHLSRWFGADSEWQTPSAAQPAPASHEAGVAASSVAPDAPDAPDVTDVPMMLALPTPPLAAPRTPAPFVPVDLAHMTALWGSESTVKSLLAAFVASLRDDLRALRPLLESGDLGAIRAWHHRVMGAVGVLQYAPLHGALEEFGSTLAGAARGAIRESGLALVSACEAMLTGIEEQAALLA